MKVNNKIILVVLFSYVSANAQVFWEGLTQATNINNNDLLVIEQYTTGNPTNKWMYPTNFLSALLATGGGTNISGTNITSGTINSNAFDAATKVLLAAAPATLTCFAYGSISGATNTTNIVGGNFGNGPRVWPNVYQAKVTVPWAATVATVAASLYFTTPDVNVNELAKFYLIQNTNTLVYLGALGQAGATQAVWTVSQPVSAGDSLSIGIVTTNASTVTAGAWDFSIVMH